MTHKNNFNMSDNTELIIREETQRLIHTATKTDKLYKEAGFYLDYAMPHATGIMMACMQGMWDSLPDRNYYKKNLARLLAENCEKIEHEFIMRKMKAK